MARSWRDIADTANRAVIRTYKESVVYTPLATGVPETVEMHFESSHHMVELESGIGIAAERPHALLRIADLSAHPEPGDTLVAQSKTYRVESGEPDGYGVVKLWLIEV